MTHQKPVVLLVLLLLGSPLGRADDWPAYGHDPARSGVAKESLTFPLAPVWMYRPAQRPRPAWQRPIRELNRMDFDYASQPVIANGLVFFGSSADDTVRALDAATGQIRWRFITGGPIRFAPQIAGGRAYVASDDGHLYCLDAGSGKLLWRFRGALKDDRIIGNGRMISRWPCRSGALVLDGIVYVTAGMWPSESVFVYALDAASGEVKWCNDTCGSLYTRMPHVAPALSGVTPQGYLLAGKGVLLVPTGRGVPAGFDGGTGRLLYYDPQGREYGTQYFGGTWCMISGNTYYNNSSDRGGRIGIASYALASGRQSGHAGRGGRRLIVGNGHSVYWTGSQLVSRDAKRKTWKAPFRNVHTLAIAGQALLVGGNGAVTALSAGAGKETWRAAVDGEAHGLAVADGRLIVATSTGAVYAFAPGSGGAAKTITDPRAIDRLSRVPVGLGAVLGLCEKARIDRGYALVVGEPDAELARSLAAKTRLHCLAGFRSPAMVASERRRLLMASDVYGSRVAVQLLPAGGRVPYPPYVANLIVVGKSTTGLSAKELYRVLRPCGGLMCFPSVKPQEARTFLRDAGIPAAEIAGSAGTVTVTRGKLPGAFDWDSKERLDARVKWPLELAWFGGPGTAPKTENTSPLPAEGRIFMVGANHIVAVDAYNGTTLWSRLISWDHNSGIVRPMPRAGNMYHFTGLAADADSVYLHMKNKLSVELDARSGALKKYHGLHYSSQSFSLKKPQTFELKVDAKHSGTVTVTKAEKALTLRLTTQDPKPCHPMQRNTYTKQVCWVDGDYWDLFFDFRPRDKRFGFYGPGAFHINVIPATKKPAAAYPGAGPRHPAFTVKGTTSEAGTDTVLTIPWAELEKIAGAKPRDFGFGVILSSFDGGRKERAARASKFADINAYGVNNGWATLALDDNAGAVQAPKAFAAVADPNGSLSVAVLRGRRPWYGRRPRSGPAGGHRHPLTGARIPLRYVRSHGCGGFTGSKHADFFRSGAIGIYDFTDASGLRNFGGARLSCGISATPALGVLFADGTVSHCVCGYNIKCMMGLAPTERRRNEDWALFPPAPFKSLVRGAALNLGAPGDRRDTGGAHWLACPRPRGKRTLRVPVRTTVAPGLGSYRFNADRVKIEDTSRPWIYTSGYRGLQLIEVRLDPLRPVVSLSAKTAPKIDGVLDDACWDGREPAPFGIGNVRDRIFLRHDDRHLYVGFTSPGSFDRAGARRPWKKRMTGRDALVWLDDACEVFLSDAKKKAYVQLGVSASGARYDACCAYPRDRRDVGVKWNGAWQSAAVAGPDALAIEMAVPWKTLADAGIERDRLQINLRARGELLRDLGIRRYEKQVRTFAPLSLGPPKPTTSRRFAVRLHFAEPDDVKPGERVFDVLLQGQTALKALDILKQAGGRRRALVKEFRGVQAADMICVELRPRTSQVNTRTAPVLCGMEVTSE